MGPPLRPVTSDFATAPQLSPEDMAQVAGRGYRLVVNNRPDGEAPGQPRSSELAAAARAAGMDYVHIPVVGAPTDRQVEAVRAAADAADGPVLAFCRSGTRSIVAWARGRVQAGDAADEVVAAARNAGYDIAAAL